MMTLTSTAWRNGEAIPAKYTADGGNVSPPMAWENAPDGTAAFALVMDDPDAPAGTWDHWLLWGVAGDVRSLAEGISAQRNGIEAKGLAEGRNSWGNVGYEGPEPPPGKPHRYLLRLYALGEPLSLPAGADKKALLAAIKDKTLATAELMGTYGR